tara:strand:- start:158 stop:430 length:273 start_codon:yes stop_codon:yes gene_type:complete
VGVLGVDRAWQMLDTENKGVILKKHSKNFLKSIEQCAIKPNAKVFGNREFSDLFGKFISESNEFTTKAEMAILIKEAFKHQLDKREDSLK